MPANSAMAAAMNRASAAAAAGAADSKWLAPTFRPPISNYAPQKMAEPPQAPTPRTAAAAEPVRYADPVAAAAEQRTAHNSTGADHLGTALFDASAAPKGQHHSYGLGGEEHTDYAHEQRHMHRATGRDHLGTRITDASTTARPTTFGIMGEEHTDYAHEQRHLHNSFGQDHLGEGCAFSAPFGTDLNGQATSELFLTVAGRGGQYDSNLLKSVNGISRQKHAEFHQASHFEAGNALLPQEVAGGDQTQGISKKMHHKFHQKSHFHGTMLQGSGNEQKQNLHNRNKASVPNKTYSSQIRLMDNQYPGTVSSGEADDPYGQKGGVRRLSYKNGSQVYFHPTSSSPGWNGGKKHYVPPQLHNEVWAWGVPPSDTPRKGSAYNSAPDSH
jgi:hypothetical protein